MPRKYKSALRRALKIFYICRLSGKIWLIATTLKNAKPVFPGKQLASSPRLLKTQRSYVLPIYL